MGGDSGYDTHFCRNRQAISRHWPYHIGEWAV
jgi:hypothetical protein